jgi:Flp pilus assembly pilin Flp
VPLRHPAFTNVRLLKYFVECSQGQDMVEYTLILAFVALAGAAALLGVGTDVNTLWTIVNTRLTAAGQ